MLYLSFTLSLLLQFKVYLKNFSREYAPVHPSGSRAFGGRMLVTLTQNHLPTANACILAKFPAIHALLAD